MICSLINQKKVSQGCVKAPGEEGRPGSVSGSPCLSPWPNRCSLSRRLRPPPRTPKHVHWAAAIPQAPMTRACARGSHNRLKTRPALPVLPQPAPGSQPRARAVEPRGDESPGRKAAFPSRPPGSESGLGIGPPPEDRGQAAWQSRHGEGPFSAARRSPGAAPALPNIVQHPASALAAAPGARRPLLAALAPSEPCGPRARAGRAPPRRAPLPTPPGRPGRLLPASLARLGLPPTPVLAPIVHGCKTPGLGLRVCGRMSARGSLRAPPLRTGTRRGLPHRAHAWRPGVHPDLGLGAPGRPGGSRRATAGRRGPWPL